MTVMMMMMMMMRASDLWTWPSEDVVQRRRCGLWRCHAMSDACSSSSPDDELSQCHCHCLSALNDRCPRSRDTTARRLLALTRTPTHSSHHHHHHYPDNRRQHVQSYNMRGKNHPGDLERQLDPDSTGLSVDALDRPHSDVILVCQGSQMSRILCRPFLTLPLPLVPWSSPKSQNLPVQCLLWYVLVVT